MHTGLYGPVCAPFIRTRVDAMMPAASPAGAAAALQGRLLVETDVESGLRWSELTQLRVRALDLVMRVLTVSRAWWRSQPTSTLQGSASS